MHVPHRPWPGGVRRAAGAIAGKATRTRLAGRRVAHATEAAAGRGERSDYFWESNCPRVGALPRRRCSALVSSGQRGDAARMPDEAPSLFPRPQQLRLLGGHCRLPAQIRLEAPRVFEASAAFVWLEQALAASGIALVGGTEASFGGAEASPPVRLGVALDEADAQAPDAARSESYRLTITPAVLSIRAPSVAGLQHGVSSLV